MSRRERMEMADVAGGMETQRANYEAARATRFRRRRTGLLVTGSSADYHYRSIYDYLKIMEYARDMDRNDSIIGASIDKAVRNTIQNGMGLDPKTGNPEIDAEIKGRWDEWADDRTLCDISAQHNFTEIEEFVFRHQLVDGDDLVLPLDSGHLQFVEAHRLRTPSGTKRNVVCGVLLDDNRKPVEYWVTRDDVDPFAPLALVGDVEKVPAFTTDAQTGRMIPNAFHVWRGKRKSQSRGVSVLAPIFDLVGMHDDIQFAEVVKRQIAACFGLIRNRAADWKPSGVDPYGRAWASDLVDSNKRLVEEIAPGFEARGSPGETITGFAPNIPGEGFFPHMRMVLQLIFNNLGLPLVMGLMDASDTNFSGWRGAVDEARRGFARNQQWLIERFHTPVYHFKLRDFLRVSAKLRQAQATLGPAFWKHQWNAPRWPYIQPLQDAQADETRQRKLLASPRKIHAERGQDWNEIVGETVADNTLAIQKAVEAANKLGNGVTWREVLFMTDPEMMAQAVKAGQLGGGAPKPAAPQPTAEDKTRDFLQKLVLQLAGNSLTAPVVANALTIAGKDGIVAGAGAPVDPEAADPYLPVTVPAGQLQVTGGVVKDGDGKIVGGAAATAVESSGGAAVKEEKPGGETGRQGDGVAAGGSGNGATPATPIDAGEDDTAETTPPKGGTTEGDA